MKNRDGPLCIAQKNEAAEKIGYAPSLPDANSEIILYQPDESLELSVVLENETVWLSADQIAALFDRDKSVVLKHTKNVFSEGELQRNSTVANFAIVRNEGGRAVERNIEYFNLDVIISVGYRVKSKRGTQFRQWANKILRDYLLKGHAINQRFEHIEHKIREHDKKIDFFVRTSLPPVQGIFFEGQIFDAHAFVSDLIRSAKRSVVLIDNYIDGTVLTLLSKRSPNVVADIHTRNITKQMHLDLKKHNEQYDPLTVHETDRFHDRFLIVDETVYHIGASFKDLGKKLFAFSEMEIKKDTILKDR